MSVLALGVSYRHAPVEVLERLSFASEDLPKAYRQLMEMEAVREGVILSTCNRVEVYADVSSYHAGFQDLKRFLAESRETAPEEFAEPLYSSYEDDAAEHLFVVTAGIDSMVVGEPQILAQVREAHRRASEEGSVGPVLGMLFQRAVSTGRRARRETAIGSSPGALVEAAIDLAEQELPGVGGRTALVVGAGHIATLAARELRRRGVSRLLVVNRSAERGKRLAALVGAEARSFDRLGEALADADLVVSSTGATAPVIGVDQVDRASREGRRRWNERPLFLADLAVPRDVEPEVGRTEGIRVAGFEDLRGAVARRDPGRGDEVERVREIVRQEVSKFSSWRRQARVAPLIHALQERGDEVRAAELARVAPRLASLSEREREAVEALAQGIVAKLLHRPIVKLKEVSARSSSESYAGVLAELFGIDRGPGGVGSH